MTTAPTRRRPTSRLLDLFRKPRRNRLWEKPLARFRPRLEALEVRLAPAVDFTQGANGDAVHAQPLGDITWINGILNPNNSEYFEGVSTLQRILFDSVTTTANNMHTLTFSHQAAKGSAHAYDFLTSWNQAVAATNFIAPGTLVDPNTDSTDADALIEAHEPGPASPANFTTVVTALRSGANFIDVTIPDNMGTLLGDNVQSRIAAYEGFFGNRTLRIYGNAAITAASMTFNGYSGSGPDANYTLTWTSTSTQILIEFAGHLAQGEDFLLTGLGYGAGKGAGSVSGGPYHISLSRLDGASLGSQDNQIQANAVSAPPNFTIDKTGDTLSKVGDAVDYTITIVNTGALPMFPQSISDSLVGVLSPSGFTESGTNNDVLDVGETWTLHYSRTVQAGDPDPLVNTVTAVFDTQANLAGIELTRSDSHSVNLFQPSLHVVKGGDTLGKVGDPVDYTFTITNTSSADSPNLINVAAVDSLLGNLLNPANPFLVSSNADGSLSPGEVWTITARRTVVAGDPDPLVNTVTVSAVVAAVPAQGFDGGNVITPDATSVLTHSVNLFQPGVHVTKSVVGNPTTVQVGDTITYQITITNTSSADSPALIPDSIVDTKVGTLSPSAFTESGTNNDILDVGETWTGLFNYLVLASDVPSLTNVVTVHFHPAGFPNDLTDAASRTLAVETGGRIAPTGTTPQQFIDFAINHTAGDPGDDDGFADGGFNYTASGGIITNVSDPGIGFYYTSFMAPSNSFTVQVLQSATSGGPEMDLNALQVLKVVGSPPNATGVVLVGNFAPFPVGTDPTVTLNTANLGEDPTGKLLVLRWRVHAKSIEGDADPGVTYTLNFKTLVNNVQVDSDPNGIQVIRSNPLHLAGTAAANPTGEQLTPEALQAAIDKAIAAWRAEGVSPEALNGLRQLNFSIDNLSNNVLGFQFGNRIVIDGDAAGYGYSTDRVNLVTVVEHELGHALGFDLDDEGVMAESLALGAGRQPASSPLASTSPPVSSASPTSSAAPVSLDAGLGLRSPSLAMVARPSTQGADVAMAITAARAEIASTESLAFLSSVRTDSGALASSPGVAIPTSHQGASERLAPHAGHPAPTAPALGLLFSDDGVTFFEEANDPPAEKAPAPPQGVIDRLFGGDETLLSDEAIDYLFGGDVAPRVGETSEPGSAGISAAVALVGVGWYLLGHRRRDRDGKSRLQWMRA
jgi:hypothetical protein